MATIDWSYLLWHHVCPTITVLLSTLMFAAPIQDLRSCLQNSSLGHLNPFPWALQTGNCFGWVAYSWYTRDAFMLAGNLPGFCFSLWLNIGAAKLQYHQLEQLQTHRMPIAADENNNTTTAQSIVLVPQEQCLFAVVAFWILVLLYVGWILPMNDDADTEMTTTHIVNILGVVNNACLLLYYGAPLEALAKVVRDRSSASIHRPTMLLSWANTSFWILFGVVRQDWYIIFPNVTGLCLGLAQGVLCVFYPSNRHHHHHRHKHWFTRGQHEHDDNSSSEEESIALESTWLVQSS